MNAQQFPASPSDQGRIAELLTGWRPALFEMRQSILASVSALVSAIQSQVDTLAGQQAELTSQQAELTDLVGKQVSADAKAASQAGAAISTASTVRTSVAFTVPDGFTQALVVSTAGVMGRNSTATADYIYVQSVVNGVSGGELYANIGPGFSGGVSSPYYRRLGGLVGGEVVTVGCATRTGFAAWDASGSNSAIVHAQVIFLR